MERDMISLNTFRKFHLHDLSALLAWLGDLSCSRRMRFSRKRPPIRTSTLVSVLSVLTEFGFIEESGERFIPFVDEDATRFLPTAAGISFLRASPLAKQATLRKLLLRDEQVGRIVELLDTSTTGRLPRKLVNESFVIGANAPVKDEDIFGFIAWAEACELFGYDRSTDEILRIESYPGRKGERWMAPTFRNSLPRAS